MALWQSRANPTLTPYLKPTSDKLKRQAQASREDNMSNCYDHELKMNMLDTYYFKDKKQAKENLNKNLQELKEWYQLELDKYITADTNFDQWFNEYTGQSFDEMLKEQASEQRE